MALEETVLDGENMTNLLKANWDISCASYRKLPIGTANCFTVNDGSNTNRILRIAILSGKKIYWRS